MSDWRASYLDKKAEKGVRRMELTCIDDRNRMEVNELIKQQWHSTDMILRGGVVDMTKADGIIAYVEKEIVGMITYRIFDDVCEILSLDSFKENQGIGSILIDEVKKIAMVKKINRIVVITTNDNIHAIRFYQRRGFEMCKLYYNAIDVSRKLKPEIPMLGYNDIPIQHEIEFQWFQWR